MARSPSQDSIERRLCQLFPTPWLEDLARQTGVLQRRRKVDPVGLFWTLVLSFGVGPTRTIAALRRAYSSATGICLSASAFYDRFTSPLVVFLQKACERALCHLEIGGPSLRGVLSHFRDLLITDASVLRLHDMLASTYPACRTNHTQAAAKLHLMVSSDLQKKPLPFSLKRLGVVRLRRQRTSGAPDRGTPARGEKPAHR